MILQEKIEILDGVKDHPNKEKLVFEIEGSWVSYSELQSQVGLEISQSDSFTFTNELNNTGNMLKQMYEDSLKERTTYMYAGKESIDLLNKMLKQE